MAAWMLYVIAAGVALALAAHLCERGLTRLDRPARWPWLASMVGTAIWPLIRAAAPVVGTSSVPGGGEAGVGMGAAAPAAGWRVVPPELPTVVPDAALVAGWGLASLVALVVLAVAAAALRRDRRGWRPAVVAGEDVLVSADVGPAVVGARRPRIVIPAWVLGLEASMQRLIVMHEREHLRSGDGRALAVGLLLVALLPWCLPLWWQFRRLRIAVETDCDRRLLRCGVSPRAYAEALLAVARQRPVLLPLAAMSSTKAAVERRIRFIVRRPARARAGAALVPLTAAVLAVVLVAIAAPVPPPSGAALAGLFGGAPLPGGRLGTELEPLSDGSLPGDPGEDAVVAAVAAYHPAAADGIPSGSFLWFVVDAQGGVRRTGMERGSEAEVIARVRARFPTETSEFVLGFEDVPAGAGFAQVLWLLPEPGR
jgi:bla regulator protein blaR1